MSTVGFSEERLAAVVLGIAVTDFSHRINRVNREQAGETW